MFIEEICIINAMCGLAYLYKLRRILKEFVKLPPPFTSKGIFVVDTVRGITTRSSFFTKAGCSSYKNSQNLFDFLN